jgi:hypothetical protein
MNNETIMRPILSGVIGAVEAAVLVDTYSMQIPFTGQSVSPPLAFGVTTALASLAGNFVGNQVLPKIPALNSVAQIGKNITTPALTGLATYGLMMNERSVSGVQSFAMGAAADIGGAYAFDTFFRKS